MVSAKLLKDSLLEKLKAKSAWGSKQASELVSNTYTELLEASQNQSPALIAVDNQQPTQLDKILEGKRKENV